jgi:hypothetical protein
MQVVHRWDCYYNGQKPLFCLPPGSLSIGKYLFLRHHSQIMTPALLSTLLQADERAIARVAQIITEQLNTAWKDVRTGPSADQQAGPSDTWLLNAVYSALTALAHPENPACRNYLEQAARRVEQDTRIPELDQELAKALAATSSPDIRFKSKFLTEQLKLGNLFFNDKTRCIQIRQSSDFADIRYKHAHRDKISSALRHEGYKYHPVLFGYLKPDFSTQ